MKLVYAATQTAGVLTVGHAIRQQNSPKLVLSVDRLINNSSENSVTKDDLKMAVVDFEKVSARAKSRTLAYTSSILAGLYLYNAMRETGDDKTLRNVYLFLSFNFTIAGSHEFYKIYKQSTDDSKALSVTCFPLPAFVYNF